MSTRLSKVLRHRPETIGITLDENGWVDIDVLLVALAEHGLPLTRQDLDRVVSENDKQRYTIDESGTRIRAAQGHSVAVRLDYVAQTPPDVLYHGTPRRNLGSILEHGLDKAERHAVHLSSDVETASRVGARRGEFVVLVVDAAAMARDGFDFQRSRNGVWLTERVPTAYLSVR
ncbi:RNA 2'-phosphotransferase [Nostocoides australiense]